MEIAAIIAGALILLAAIFLIILAHTVFKVTFTAGFDFSNSAGRYENSKKQPYMERVFAGMDHAEELPHRRVEIESFDGLKLSARYYDRNNGRLMLLFHGYRSKAEYDFGCMLDDYFDMGYDVLLVDQRAHGMSEGRYITFVVNESRDCLSWCEYAANELGAKKLVLAGISMGAATVMTATASGLPANVRAIIADCGFTSAPDILTRILINRVHIPLARFVVHVTNLLFCRPHGFDLFSVSSEEAMKKNTIPTLFIHGEEDGFVPCDMGRRNHAACAAKKELLIIPECDHAMSYLVDTDRVRAHIDAFLRANV